MATRAIILAVLLLQPLLGLLLSRGAQCIAGVDACAVVGPPSESCCAGTNPGTPDASSCCALLDGSADVPGCCAAPGDDATGPAPSGCCNAGDPGLKFCQAICSAMGLGCDCSTGSRRAPARPEPTNDSGSTLRLILPDDRLGVEAMLPEPAARPPSVHADAQPEPASAGTRRAMLCVRTT